MKNQPNYHRLNPPLPRAVELDDVSSMQYLVDLTTAYLEDEETGGKEIVSTCYDLVAKSTQQILVY